MLAHVRHFVGYLDVFGCNYVSPRLLRIQFWKILNYLELFCISRNAENFTLESIELFRAIFVHCIPLLFYYSLFLW